MTEELTKEQKFYQYVRDLPKEKLNAIRGNPKAVLQLYDDYPEFFMNIGSYKGEVIVKEIKKKNPKIMIELGGYLGYSAILFASELKQLNKTAKYYSFEANPDYANIATYMFELAGILNVEIIIGKASFTLPDFQDHLFGKKYTPLDFIFIDHWKDLYVPDLRVMESLNLIAPGTVIAADNIYHPGAPEYVKYVNMSPEEKYVYNKHNKNPEGERYPGRGNILYETETIPVTNPKHDFTDAVEITKCVDFFSG